MKTWHSGIIYVLVDGRKLCCPHNEFLIIQDITLHHNNNYKFIFPYVKNKKL